MKLGPVLISALMMADSAQAAPPAGPEVVTGSGVVRGAASAPGIVMFKAIPYAAPPVGPLRWRAPQPAPHWTGVRDATAFGSPCFASPLPGPASAVPQSEDCLTLNIWTPVTGIAAKRPVMAWIHGGGFQFGSSAQPGYDGTRLAAHDVVVVTINYRLGVLGFLAHPSLDNEGPASGNYGLQDQIAALRWVRANIAAFGGDRDNITVFGESAGAHAIGILMASPIAKGLFAKAIVQSGAFWDSEHGSIATHDEAVARGVAFQKRLGAADLASLRAMPAAQLNTAARWDFRLDPGTTAFGPSVDGHVLRDAPAAVFARGDAARVPLLAGWDAVEQTPLFVPRALPHESPQAFKLAATKQFGADRMVAFEALYPPANRASAETLVGDLVITQQTWEMLVHQQKVRRNGVYAYQFSFTSPYSPIANHGAEVKYMFGNLSPAREGNAPDAQDHATADLMMTYWTNFATKGDPNGAGLPKWPAYRGPASPVLDIAAGTAAATTEPGTARYAFIRSLRKKGRFPDAWRTDIPPASR